MTQSTEARIRVLYGEQIGQLSGRRPETAYYAITSMHQAHDDILWVSIPEGLVALAGQTVVEEYAANFPLVVSFQNTLWYADNADTPTIFAYQAGRWTPNAVPFRRCRSLLVLSNGWLLAAADKSIWASSDSDRWEELLRLDFDVALVREAGPTHLWITTQQRYPIIQYNLTNRTFTAFSPPSRGQAGWKGGILAMLPEAPDRGWVSSGGHGLLHWDGENWSRIGGVPRGRPLAAGVPGYVADFCTAPATGRLWLGAMYGMAYLENGKWWQVVPAHREHDSLQSGIGNTRSLHMTMTGRLFIGGEYGNIEWVDTQAPIEIHKMNNIGHAAYKSIRLRTL